MNVTINVIKKNKVFLFLPSNSNESLNLQDYYEHIRCYIASKYPETPYSFAIGNGEPYAAFIIINANNDLEEPQGQIII